MKIKRLISFLLCVVLVFSLLPVQSPAAAGYTPSDTSGMTEINSDSVTITPGQSYKISNYENLSLHFYNLCRTNNFSGVTVYLAADITATSAWAPIGWDNANFTEFKGTFDGNGYTITGYNVTYPYQYSGLFGKIGSGGIVKNLTLNNCYFTGGKTSVVGAVGAIAGALNGGAVRNCRVTGGSVYGGDGASVGGVVGDAQNGEVSSCSSEARVYGTAGSYAGGIAGRENGGTISSCAALNPNIDGCADVGRVVGIYGHSGDLTENIAWNGMQVYLNGSPVASFSDSGKHGASKTTAELRALLSSSEAYFLPDALPGYMTAVSATTPATVTVEANSSASTTNAVAGISGGSVTMKDVTSTETGSESLVFSITADKTYPYPISVSYRTLDGSAKAGTEYAAASGTAVILPGNTQTVVTVSVNAFSDNSTGKRWDGDRNFVVQFSDPVSATLVAGGGLSGSNGRSVSCDVKLNKTGNYTTSLSISGDQSAGFFSDISASIPGGSGPGVTKTFHLPFNGVITQPFLNSLNDSNAGGVLFTTQLVCSSIDESSKPVEGNITLLDGSGTQTYSVSSYAGWPDTVDVKSGSGSISTNVYNNHFILEPAASSSTYPQYIVPKSEFNTFSNLGNAANQRFELYGIGVPDAGSGTFAFTGYVQCLYFKLVDFTAPVVTGVTAAAGTYRPGDVIPVTAAFSEPVAVSSGAALTINGETAPFAGSDCSTDTFATFLYTVQDVDNSNLLQITGVSDAADFTDLSGINPLDVTGGTAGINLANYPIPVSGLLMDTPLKSAAITGLAADKGSYSPSDTVYVMLTDNSDNRISQWLRDTVAQDNTLGGAYLAVRNPNTGLLDTYPLKYMSGGDGNTSCIYTAAFPASRYTSDAASVLQMGVYYGDNVTRNADGSFSGGVLNGAANALVSVSVNPVILVSAVTLDTTKYPESHVVYTTAATATQLAATITPSGATFPQVTWSSGDTGVAAIDATTGVISPVAPGEVTFTATANNGGIGTPVSATTPVFTVKNGDAPAIVVPTNANRFSTKQGEDATIRWHTNLNYTDTDFTIAVYPGGSATGTPVFDKTYDGSSGDTRRLDGPSLTIPGNLLTNISIPAPDLTMSPAYTFTVSAANPDNPSQTLSATGYIVIYPHPASVKFDALPSYYLTDAATSVDIGWTLRNVSASGDAFTLNIYKNDGITPIYTTSAIANGHSHYTLNIPKVASGDLKDVYTVQAGAANIAGPCTDSFQLTVYSADALKIMVKDADGNIVDTPASTLTLSNRNYVANLYNSQGSAGILDLRRDIHLQNYIGINYGTYAWNAISDQIAWLSDNTAAASLNYRQGSGYEPLSSFTYTKYPPGTSLSLAGERDGSAAIIATHARTGQQVTLNVNVQTLKDQLYLFQFYPRQTTTASYTNGDGRSVTLTSDANGALAAYEPKGIKGSVTLRSGGGDTVYLGTIYNQSLKSGEQDSANRGLYPVNIFQLRNTKLEVSLKNPDGTPYSGDITYSGAVYKNGRLCTETVVQKVPEAVPSRGLFTLNLDASRFWTGAAGEDLKASDKLEFLFILECGSNNAYYPAYIDVDGNLNTADLVRVGANVTQLRANNSGVPNPFIAAQFVSSDSLIGKTDVLTSASNVGPSDRVPKETLATTVLWWGEDPDGSYGARLETAAGAPLESQTVHTYKLPFYNAAVTVDDAVLSGINIGPGTAFNLGPGDAVPAAVSLLKGDSLYLRQPTTFLIANGVGLLDPESSPALEGDLHRLVSNAEKDTFTTANVPDSESKNNILTALKILQKLSYIPAMPLQITYAPTSDPFLYTAVVTIGGNGEVGELEYAAELYIDFVSLAGGAYIQADIRFDHSSGDWNMQPTNGGLFTTLGMLGEVTPAVVQLIVPITIKLDLQAAVNMALQFSRSAVNAKKTDVLLTTGLTAGISAFAGFVMEYDDIFCFKLGVVGGLGLGGYFSNLAEYLSTSGSTDTFKDTPAAVLNFNGQLGLIGEINIIGFDRSITYTIASFSINMAQTGDFSYIQHWVETNGIQDYFGIYSAKQLARMAFDMYASGRPDQANALLYSISGGRTITETDSGWTVENRAYLNNNDRTWGSAPSGRLLMLAASSASSSIQTNAYPNSDPMVSNDGQLMLYRSDAGSTDINDMNISYASANGSGYIDKGRIDTSGSVLPAASDFDFDGNGSFAAAAWVAQSQSLACTDPNHPTDSEIDAALNNTEIVSSVYSGGAWVTTRLTGNNQIDMAPAVAANGGKVLAAWHGMAGSGTVGGKVNPDNVSDQILYRTYNGTKWSDAANVLYNGSLGPVRSVDAAMLADGTAAVVYTVNLGGSGSDADDEIYCTMINSGGDIVSTLRLTTNNNTDINAQVMAATIGGTEQFVVGWYNDEQTSGGGTSADIVLAAVSKEGQPSTVFSDSVSAALSGQNVKIGSNFHFSKTADNDITNLSILWSELRANTSHSTGAASSVLRAVKLVQDSGGGLYFTAPKDIYQTADGTQITHFDGWYDNGAAKSVNVLMLIKDYSDDNGTSSILEASASFGDTIAITASVDEDEIVHGFDTAFPFVITNKGATLLDSVVITLSDHTTSKEFDNLNLLPNRSVTLYLPYSVPTGANSIKDLDYTVTPTFTGGSAAPAIGTLDIAIPDIGITSIEPVSAGNGLRTFRVSLQNRSNVEFAGNTDGYAAHLGIYTESSCRNLAKDDSGNDMSYTFAGDELALLDSSSLTKLITYALPSTGFANGDIRLYAKVWATDGSGIVSQYYTGNDTASIAFSDPVAANRGNPIQLTVVQKNAPGNTTADITVKNLSLTPALNGNLAVSLLSADGTVLETKVYAHSAGDLISLGKEGSQTLRFNFAQTGYSVRAIYFTASVDLMNANLSSLNLFGVSFGFDSGTASYNVTAANLGSTTLTAASVNPGAAVHVLDAFGKFLASGTGAVSYTLPLVKGGQTSVSIRVVPENNAAPAKTYSLRIANTASAARGIIISAAGNGTVTVSAADLTDFTPATWQYNLNGTWSAVNTWSSSNSFKPTSASYGTLFVRAFDAAGRYMDSNTISPAVSLSYGGGNSEVTSAQTLSVNGVPVSYTLKGGVATLSISDAELSQIISHSSGTVSFDLSAITGTTAVKLSATVLKKLSASGLVAELKLPDGTIELGPDAISSFAAQTSGGDITISLSAVDRHILTLEQQKIVGNNTVYDISISGSGGKITAFGGKGVTITLPYTLKNGEKAGGVSIWYLDQAGKLTAMPCTYDAVTGRVCFTVPHLSYYVVGYNAQAAINPFKDVSSADWFYGSVLYVYQNGLLTGTSSTAFSPAMPITRAMLVTVLHRLAGVPASSGSNSFSDVAKGQWYSNAISWANANGIVSGYPDGLFGTNDQITREQLAVILYRYARKEGYDVSAASDLTQFKDGGDTHAYAKDAVKWAVGAGLISGKPGGILTPSDSATRAEVAAILMRFKKAFVK
jgi:hypothetical protein